jgi:hypothetical protein
MMLLLEGRADIDWKDNDGEEPLWWRVWKNNEDISNVLKTRT